MDRAAALDTVSGVHKAALFSIARPARCQGGSSQTSLILNGEKPATMSVQQSTRVNLYINLKTAKSLKSRSRARRLQLLIIASRW